MKFVNYTIPAQESNAIFSKDHKKCDHKIARDNPFVYEPCQYYSSPTLRQTCESENKRRLNAYKKRRKKLYIQCLAQRGWQEVPHNAEN